MTSFRGCKNLKLSRKKVTKKVHTTNVLGTLIKHASEVAIMLFGGSVRRQTVYGAVLDAGCNTNAARFALFQTTVNAGTGGKMSHHGTSSEQCYHQQHHHPHERFNIVASLLVHGW